MKPVPRATTRIRFTCDPKRVDELVDATLAAIAQIKKRGPDAQDVKDEQAKTRRQYETALKTNGFWARCGALCAGGWSGARVAPPVGRLERRSRTSPRFRRPRSRCSATTSPRPCSSPKTSRRPRGSESRLFLAARYGTSRNASATMTMASLTCASSLAPARASSQTGSRFPSSHVVQSGSVSGPARQARAASRATLPSS